MSDAILHTGGCRCGAVRFEANAEPHHVSYCHCDDCRRATGAPVSAFVGFTTDAVTLRGEALRRFENGPATRSFCGVCGSPITYTDQRLANRIYFMLGAMDAPAQYQPTLHAYVSEQLPFVQMPDGLPRHMHTSVPRPEENQ
ncbi:GFA family protein [Pseudaminobacter sp. 19-2017]|uniref:GFA family protein n=1 Tax=Pseudaminobacter soli (ex Zhang et al. 2022) TaxID=2831468 RepID=A0A942E1K4_9HYPH|nr:GFA family protein [Pseudaminobacter soli]MBS3651247.1 GFA family protein [Pseudaminobacter soli]